MSIIFVLRIKEKEKPFSREIKVSEAAEIVCMQKRLQKQKVDSKKQTKQKACKMHFF